MISTPRLAVALLLLAAGAVLAALLMPQHYGLGSAAATLCGEGMDAGCDAVNRSSWSELAGVPLAAIGLAFYASLAALIALAWLGGAERRAPLAALALVATGAALAVDVLLLAVQAFAIGDYCALCLTTYVATLGALVALLPARGALRRLPALPDAPEGRLALGGWGLTTLAVSLGVAAFTLQLDARQELAEATLLGAPVPARAAPPAPEAPVETPVAEAVDPVDPVTEEGPQEEAEAAPPAEGDAERLRQQAQAAEAEVRRLKELLDDPQKLEQYRSDQAQATFDSAAAASLDLSGAPVKGPADPAIRVVEYSDFLCPYCRSLAGAFANYLPRSGGRVAIYFKHYPLDPACNPAVRSGGHPGACALALGAICAQEQGKFWPYHDSVFGAEHSNPGIPEVLGIGDAAGLDRQKLEQCLIAPSTRARLDRDIAEASDLGVSGTPTVYINGKRLPRINDFVRIVASEAERLGLPPPPASP